MFDLVPAGTIGTREMIHRVFEKITGEELVIPVERLKRSELEGMVLLPGYSLKGDPEEIQRARLDTYGILCEALQKGELVLEVEDDTGKRYAIPACNFGVSDGLDTVVTGTFISPALGNKKQTVCFADREMFNKWLSSRFPDDTEETRTAPAVSPKGFSLIKVTTWYKERVAQWEPGPHIPNREDDLVAARAEFGDTVSRAFMRELRRKYAPRGKLGRKPTSPRK